MPLPSAKVAMSAWMARLLIARGMPRAVVWMSAIEPHWVWWRLVLLVFCPDGGGVLGSVERGLELCWGDVVAVAVQPLLVVPVHPCQGGQFELVDVVPDGGSVGPVDALGLVQPVGGLGQGGVAGIGGAPDGGAGAELVRPCGEPHTGELAAGVGVGDQSGQPPCPA